VATTEWESITLGQNKTIQKIATAAAKASELLDANVKLASGTLKAAGIFLQGLLGPYILLLRVTADTIDDFVKDFKNIGFFILEVCPDGKYLLPKDADGNPISIVLGGVAVAASAATAAAAGQTIEFKEWAKEFLGEEDIYLTGAQKANYPVPVGKSQPPASRTDNASDNKLATFDGLTGLYKMTPSQVIATMIAAMDDELDLRRPQLSSSAEAGAIVMIVGVSDLTKNLANLQSIFKAFLTFFGGEEKKDKSGKTVAAGGVATGVAKLGSLIEAALGQANDPSKNDTTLTVNGVCGLRGTEDDAIILKRLKIPYNFGAGGTTSNLFELNDFVVGPRVKFGQRCMGYVSKINSTEADTEAVAGVPQLGIPASTKESEVYSVQELVIRGVTELDAIGFRTLSTGAKLQKVSFDYRATVSIDQNSGTVVKTGPYNDFEYIPNLPDQEYADVETVSDMILTHPIARGAFTKVVHNPSADNPWLLKKMGDGEDIREVHKEPFSSGIHTTQNTVIGDILSPKTPEAPHPNFKASKLEDLIGDFNVFFASIDALTDTLRKMADDAGKALQDIIDYLDSKIAELEEINAALQKILALFSIGLPAAGIYTLKIPVAVGGNEYIKGELSGAANAPPDSLDFTFGFMLIGEGVAFKTLQDLLIPG
jgi:hypothetical protein